MTSPAGEPLRMDVLLHRLCLTRSRSEGKTACEAGAVLLDGRQARASDMVGPGRCFSVRYPGRLLEVELLQMPGKSVSRQQARELYRVIREQRLGDEPF